MKIYYENKRYTFSLYSPENYHVPRKTVALEEYFPFESFAALHFTSFEDLVEIQRSR